MGNELMNADSAAVMERVMIVGDLAQLTPQERVSYYGAVCKSVGLNPLTKPFEYITLNGKLTLYARKDATDQLRRIQNVSIGKPEITFQDDLIIVAVEAHDGQGRTDSDVGVVKKGDMRGDAANALMKAITKAKRRVTLSICGLGWLDETEVETIPDARPAVVRDDGVIDSTPKRMSVADAIPSATANSRNFDPAELSAALDWLAVTPPTAENNTPAVRDRVKDIAERFAIHLNGNGTTLFGAMKAVRVALEELATK